MDGINVYLGSNLMDMALIKAYTMQRNRFKGEIKVSATMRISFDITKKPSLTLIPNSSTYNCEIKMDEVQVTIKRFRAIRRNEQVKNIPVVIKAKIDIVDDALKVKVVTVTANYPALISAEAKNAISSNLNTIGTRLSQTILIPQLTNILSSNLSIYLRRSTVINGPTVEVGAGIVGLSSLQTADAPTQSNIEMLNSGSAQNAKIIGIVSNQVVNILLQSLVSPITHRFNEKASKWGFGAGIKGTIQASVPKIQIANSSGGAKTTISFSSLKGGIKEPLSGWHWIDLPKPVVEVTVTHILVSSGNTGLIKLTGIDSIHVPIDLPSLLNSVEGLIESLINSVLSLFRGMISDEVDGTVIEVFKLPSKIPGTTLSANLSFESGGLGYYKSSLRAMIRITT